jgi:hypothetical protein
VDSAGEKWSVTSTFRDDAPEGRNAANTAARQFLDNDYLELCQTEFYVRLPNSFQAQENKDLIDSYCQDDVIPSRGNPPSLFDKEVMPVVQFLLNVLAGVLVVLIVRWIDRLK